MSIPILTTKLYVPPPRPSLVRRPRLLERLNAGLYGKLTLISAPAGFGKTTLVCDWISTLEQPVAWLSLDEEDGDPTRFLAYLIAALQRVAANLGETLLGALHSPQPPPTEALLTALLNELIAWFDSPSTSSGNTSTSSGNTVTNPAQGLVLFLDDYHLIDARAVDQILTFLIDYLPPQLHLVISTREDPNLPLARLRARGELAEVRVADLHFTRAEATAFLNSRMGLQLTPDEVAALEARTEGWIAGLQLAALSMQGHGPNHQDSTGFIHSFTGSHRFVMDYLVEEVLHQQPAYIQQFLLRTSILNRLCGALCDAVLGEPAADGQAMLEALDQANLFLIPLDNERRWYRYHHLFADLLRQRLQQRADSSATEEACGVAEYHRRAGKWYAANDLPLDALHHALAAAEFEWAAALLERTWRTMDDNRQSATWLAWVQALPAELIRARPVLSVGCAWSLLERGELEAANGYLQDAEQWLQRGAERGDDTQAPATAMVVADEAEFQALPATIAAARTYRALALGDLSGTVTYARQTLDLLPADSHLRRGVPAALLGLAYWATGELELAYRTFAEGMMSFQQAGNILFAITGTYFLADIRRVQGRLRDAVRIYQQSLELAAGEGELVRQSTADLYTGLSEICCEQGDLETATAYLQKSKALGELSLLPRWRYRWSLAQAKLYQTRGELERALEWLDEAEHAHVRGPVPDVRPLAAQKARLWIAQNRLAAAVAWAEEQDLSIDDDLSYLREFEHITLARLLIARSIARDHSEQATRFLADALTLLARLLHAAETGGRTGSVIEILLLQALAHAAQEETPAALAPLARALALAEPEGYVRLFVNEGAPPAQLLTEAAAQGIQPHYTQKLLALFDAQVAAPVAPQLPQAEKSAPQQLPAPPSPSVQPLIEPLSEREVEVLHLIAQGLSNREISEQLYIALSTVKGHNRVIYGKLQVSRRTEAVARARALGLV